MGSRVKFLSMAVLVTAALWGVAQGELASVTRMRQALTQHFSEPRHHVTGADYKHATMEFIRDQFRGFGLETHIHTFPTELDNVTGINVIGVLKGANFNTPQDSIMAIGAHYDTMRDTPGVDDNGAAMVVTLEAARILSQNTKRNDTILFIAFDFEEWELPSVPLVACGDISCGSRALVKDWLPNFFPVPLNWRGIFVMDTIMNFNETEASQKFPDQIDQIFPSETADIQADGYQGDFLMIAGRGQDQSLLQSFSQQWAKQGRPQYELEQFVLPMLVQQLSNFARSDHASFWAQDLKAIFITDTADFRGYMTRCYHHSCDTIDRVTDGMLGFAAKTCDTLVAIFNALPATSASPSHHLENAAARGILVLTTMLLPLLRPAL